MISEEQAAAILRTCRAQKLVAADADADADTRGAGRRTARRRRSIFNFDLLAKFKWGLPILYKIEANFSESINFRCICASYLAPSSVAELVEHRSHVREIVQRSNPWSSQTNDL